MPKYTTILLDADGTLFDFDKAQRLALNQTLEQLGYIASEQVHLEYAAINTYYWSALEQGHITKEVLAVQRFADLFAKLQIKANPSRGNALYLRQLGQAAFLLPDAEEVCKTLSQYCRLIIVTNGIATTQRERLKKSLIAPYISNLIVSEDAGFPKPDSRFFDYAFDQCNITHKENTLMVGDSLSADIKGGNEYDLDTCWVNFLRTTSPSDCSITYTITSLSQLPELIFSS